MEGGRIDEERRASPQVIAVDDHDQITPVAGIVVQNISPIRADLVMDVREIRTRV